MVKWILAQLKKISTLTYLPISIFLKYSQNLMGSLYKFGEKNE